MKIRYSILPTLMISVFSYPVQSSTTVTTYQDLLDELSASTTADVVLDMNGNGIDLDGANGVTVSKDQSVVFKNIGTEGSSSWTDTKYNITNYGTISINNVIFTGNKSQANSNSAGGVIDNRNKINNITADFTDNSSYSTQGISYGGAIYSNGEIGDITRKLSGNISDFSITINSSAI